MNLQRGNDLGGSRRVRLELKPMVCGPWRAVIGLWSENDERASEKIGASCRSVTVVYVPYLRCTIELDSHIRCIGHAKLMYKRVV